MKKLLNVALALGMALTGIAGGVTVFARENTNTIDVNGFIGLYGPETNPEDGDQLPEFPDLPGDFINVQVPANVSWYVTAETNGQVRSADYDIVNHSPNANLAVTLVRYEEQGSVSLSGELDLNLTGHLELTNVLERENFRFGEILLSEAGLRDENLEGTNQWTFGFGGSYTGNIPARALQPTYEMVLQFEVDSYSTFPQ